MRFLTTFLAALAASTALLVGAGIWIDAPRHEMQSTGLTAATVLGTDMMPPWARPPVPDTVASGAVDVGVAAGEAG